MVYLKEINIKLQNENEQKHTPYIGEKGTGELSEIFNKGVEEEVTNKYCKL